MPMEGVILQKARLGTSSAQLPGHSQGVHAPNQRLQALESFSAPENIPLLPKLNQMNKHDSESLFSSFPAHHRDSWAGRSQCHCTETNGIVPIYIRWWFKPPDFLSGTHFFSTKPGCKAEPRTEVETLTAGLNSHFLPCSCITTAGILQKSLQCSHVSGKQENTTCPW